MNLYQQAIDLIKTGTSFRHFYRNMNVTLKRLNGNYTMLHFPMEEKPEQSFIQGQINLTNFCLASLGDVRGLRLLEIGCGNGVQAKYICQNYDPAFVTGIDLNPDNINIAQSQQKIRNIHNMLFLVDDAQELNQIDSGSMDAVICIESAFHYPDKEKFLKQLWRVLKPGGRFLVADLLTTVRSKGTGIRRLWKGKMELNHWNVDLYQDHFKKCFLHLKESFDITERVIGGFRGYQKWISEIERTGIIRDFFFKIFYTITIEWLLFLLRYRRRYMVFVGIKSI